MSILAGGAVVGFALLGRTDLSLLTIGLSFLARLQLVDAFSTSFTSATSCGAFTVNWNATAEQSIGPPFSLLIVPVNSPDAPADSSAARGPGSLSPPIRRDIPESAWNAASRSGSYTIDQLPLQAGERFIVVMDDGFGYGTGGVSLIHRVETSGSSPTSCIPSSPANGNVYFAISSLNPAQCSPLTVLVNSPTEIRGFIPGGSPFSLDMPASTSGNVTVSWSVNIATGSSFVLFYRAQNGDLATSGLMESTAAGQFGDGCMSNAPHSTITGSPSQTNGAQVTTNSGSKKISIPALVGGIIGGLGFLAAVALITFFVIIRRTDSMGRSRSVSTASGFKGRSYDFNTSNDRSSTGGTSAGYQNINKNKKEEGLEGRFGGKLFGGGKKKGGNASGSGGNMRTYTSSQRRAIYPGLSIASTQNRSIGLVTLDEPTHDVQMNPMPTMHQPSNPKTGHNDPNGRYPTTAVERIQNEVMSVSTDITGYTGRDSISISNAHQSSYSGQPLMTDSGTKNTSSVSDTPLNSNTRTNERPSTAPTSGGAPGFHLPSGWRRPSSDGDNIDNPNGEQSRNNMQLHEYPPDDKSAMRSRSSRRTVDRIDEGTDILTDDEYVPPVREDIFPPERHEDVTDTEALGSWDRRVVVDHPYATAQSPHVDGYDDAGRRIRGASVSHPYSDPLNSSSGSYPPTSFSSNRDRSDRRPNSRRRGVEESPTIIRHTDAGRFGLDDDDQSQESGRRRRVVELPPAYGEFSEGRGGRSRERV
ncbi:hypothetical protein CPB86DRAFT_54018 [Serendipita vermifera]|nr:hypothetical protein CPB86DRAFT_54018 [Serendipita vermifera]